MAGCAIVGVPCAARVLHLRPMDQARGARPNPAEATGTMRRSPSARCATGSTTWRRATGSPSSSRTRTAVRGRGLCQTARRPAGNPVPASRRPSDPGGFRPVSDRGWMAEAMGVEPPRCSPASRTRRRNPLPWHEVKSAPAQEVVHRGKSTCENPAAADAQRARRRTVHQRRPADRAQSEDRQAERLHPPLPGERPRPARRADSAAPHHSCSRWPRRPASRSTPRSWSASIR